MQWHLFENHFYPFRLQSFAFAKGGSQEKCILKLNSNAFGKYEYGDWYNSLYEVLKQKQNFCKNVVVTGKALLFVISPFCTLHSICFNIGFWHGCFVWKCCVFNFCTFYSRSTVPFFEKNLGFSSFKIKVCRSLKRGANLKILSTSFLVEPMLFLLALKLNLWEESAFLCSEKNY